MYYTLGQRKGLQIGGVKGMPEAAWYVVDKDLKKNHLIVASGDNHPRLMSQALICNDCHWVSGSAPVLPLNCNAKTRYRQQDQSCLIELAGKGQLKVKFRDQQRAVTPGQAIVFYQNDVCLGGATIKERLENG